MKLDQNIANAFDIQSFQISSSEFGIRMIRIGKMLVKLVQPPMVVIKILLVFRVDSAHFSFSPGGVEEGRNEELGESVEGSVKAIRCDIKEIIGVFLASKRITRTTML